MTFSFAARAFSMLNGRFHSLSLVAVSIVVFLAGTHSIEGQVQPVQAAASPLRISDSFADIAKKVEPAVVSIDAKARMPEVSSRNRTPPVDSDDILEFLQRQMPRRQAAAVGSGFIVDKAGYILTNGHVVENATRIIVKLNSGEEFNAELLGVDEETDMAVLKIDAGRDLPFVTLGDSDRARVGDWVLAIGSPFGLSRTVTAGIISHVQRDTPTGSPFQRFIQTDAAINRGNSGGPLVNLAGEVIGVNSQIATSTGDYNGIGFALPSRDASQVYEQLRTTGKVRRGYLGVFLDSVKAEYAKVYGMRDERGAIVTHVRDADGPAAAAGLKAGDVIVEFDGKPVASAQDLISKVSSTGPDRSVVVAYLRDSGTAIERKNVTMRLGERPPNRTSRDGDRPTKLPADPPAQEQKPFGLTLTAITPEMATSLNIDRTAGLVVKEISPESLIADVKLSSGVDAIGEGDIIQRINRKPVADPAAFGEIVRALKKGDAVVMHVLTPVSGTQTQLKIVQFTVQ